MTTETRPFDHVLVVMFENQYRGSVFQNDYFRELATRGVDLAASHGVMHPSQTNYIAAIAGELCNVTYDSPPPAPLTQKTIVDLLEDAGLTWKAYMDGYDPVPWGEGLVPADQLTYVIKHDPFTSFASIQGSPDRWAKIVDAKQLWIDVANGTLPHFAWFTPDMWNDGHYQRGHFKEPPERAPVLVDQAAEWLRWFLGTLQFPGPNSLLPPRSLVAVTFDEADFEALWEEGRKGTYDGPNQIYTVLLGDDVVEPGSVEHEGYNHYGLLRTIEENFGLGTLGKNDADSNWFRFLWGEQFGWSEPSATPIPATGAVAAAGRGDACHVVYADGALVHTAWDGAAWSEPAQVATARSEAVALASAAGGLTLVYAAGGDRLEAITSPDGESWSDPQTVVAAGAHGSIALAACNRGADLMLAYRSSGGTIASVRRTGDAWGEPVPTGHATEGDVALCALGHTLLLVFPKGDEPVMHVATYTTAAFNTTQVPTSKYGGGYDDTVADTWSPTAAFVAHFAAVTTPQTAGEPEPTLQPYRTHGPIAMAALDGVVHLAYSHDGGLRTARYSIPGVLTAKLPITYRAADARTTSNGFGTIAEAGWTLQEHLGRTGPAGGGALTAASTDSAAFVLYEPEGGAHVEMMVGRYTTP